MRLAVGNLQQRKDVLLALHPAASVPAGRPRHLPSLVHGRVLVWNDERIVVNPLQQPARRSREGLTHMHSAGGSGCMRVGLLNSPVTVEVKSLVLGQLTHEPAGGSRPPFSQHQACWRTHDVIPSNCTRCATWRAYFCCRSPQVHARADPAHQAETKLVRGCNDHIHSAVLHAHMQLGWHCYSNGWRHYALRQLGGVTCLAGGSPVNAINVIESGGE